MPSQESSTPDPRLGKGFSPDAQVVVREVDATNWELEQGFWYGAKSRVFTVETGEKTDFASVPRPLIWLVARYGTYTLPAILHDHLYRIEVKKPQDPVSYRDADGILRQAMRDRGVPFLTRWVMWTAVRTATFFRKGGWQSWLSDLPRVLLFLIPGGLLVAPATLLILLTLAVVYVLEFIVYGGLKANESVRKRLDKPTKKVVRPTFRRKPV